MTLWEHCICHISHTLSKTPLDQHRTVWFLKTVHSFHDQLATYEVSSKAVWPTGFHLHLASDLSLPCRAESSTPPSRY